MIKNRMSSYMFPIKFSLLWGWKGDYWNLGAGSEVGLYYYDDKNYSGTDHYYVVNEGDEVPMTLYLYDIHNLNTHLSSQRHITNIFSWEPNDPYTAQSYMNIGVLHHNFDRYEEALDWYVKSYKSYVASLGTDHPATEEEKSYMEFSYEKLELDAPFEEWLEKQIA